MITLTDEQKTNIDAIVSSTNPVEALTGYAGTGKTSCLPYLVQALLAAPLDDSKDRIVAAAQAAFTQAITEETGRSPKDWYESVAAKSAEPIGAVGRPVDNASNRNISVKGGTSADYTRIMQEVSSLVEAEAKAHEEAARLAAEKAEESERSGMAERPTLV